MQEQLITLETAKLAKKLGFNEKCLYNYTNKGEIAPWDDLEYIYEEYEELDEYLFVQNSELKHNYISAPTQSFLQKWLRKTYKKVFTVSYCKFYASDDNVWYFTLRSPNSNPYWEGKSHTYEEALEKALEKTLNLITNEDNKGV